MFLFGLCYRAMKQTIEKLQRCSHRLYLTSSLFNSGIYPVNVHANVRDTCIGIEIISWVIQKSHAHIW